MEFPAVSQTRLEFWKQPQYTQTGMWWFTLVFGFFGLHHLLLRSPQTALIFFIANILLLGYPWFYDLIQLSSYGGLNTEGLNEFGLGHPWGSLGLAKGMWLQAGKQSTGDAPNPWWFLLYVLTLPIAVLANLIAGDKYNAFARFLCHIIIPFGSILTLCAFFYDSYILLLKPEDLLVNGSKRIFPFTVLGMDYDGHSPGLTGVKTSDSASCSNDSFIISFLKLIGSSITGITKGVLTVGTFIAPEIVIPIEEASFIAGSAVDNVIGVSRDGLKAVGAAIEVGKEAAKGVVEVGTEIVKGVGETAIVAGEVAKLASVGPRIALGSLQQTAQQISKIHVPSSSGAKALQSGGGSISTLDYLGAGSIVAVIVGGLFMAAKHS